MLRLTRQAERGRISERQMGVMEQLRAEIEDMHRQKKLIEAEISATLEKSAGRANAKINIRRELNSGAAFRIGFTTRQITDYREGSWSVIEYRGRDLKFLRLTPLDRNARDLEADLIAQEEAAARRPA
jgi:hypothetical protein